MCVLRGNRTVGRSIFASFVALALLFGAVGCDETSSENLTEITDTTDEKKNTGISDDETESAGVTVRFIPVGELPEATAALSDEARANGAAALSYGGAVLPHAGEVCYLPVCSADFDPKDRFRGVTARREKRKEALPKLLFRFFWMMRYAPGSETSYIIINRCRSESCRAGKYMLFP